MEIKESVTTKVLDPGKNTTKFGRMDGSNNDGHWEDVYYILLFPEIPVSAKHVASGGMIRGMFRRYVSGV